MSRIILSIIFGFIFPILYVLPLFFLDSYIPEKLLLTKIYQKPAPGLLLAPVVLPTYFTIFVNENRILPQIFNTVWFRIISLVLFNWILYGAIFYFILGQFKRFKMEEIVSSPEPPAPPIF